MVWVFVAGTCPEAGKPWARAGYAVRFRSWGSRNCYGIYSGRQTVLEAELHAAIKAVKIAIRDIQRTFPSLAWMMPTAQIWSKDPLVKTTIKKKEKDYTTANIGDFFELLDVPNMAIMYKDVQSLTADLPDPGVKVCHYLREG